MKISVIVPVYNVEKYLPECIESILAQTFTDYELILIDDGSSDNSPHICDEYAQRDSRIIVLHKDYIGVSEARNEGLNIAQGEYISFIDSDDVVPPWMLLDLYQTIKKTDADLVKGNFQRFVNDIDTVDDYDNCITELSTFEAMDNYLSEPFLPNKKVNIVVWNAIYKKSIFANIRFPKGLLYEDGYVTPQVILAAKKIAHLNKVIYFYRSNPKSIMSRGLSKEGLKSLNDWKDIHHLIKNTFPDFNNETCRRWINKYIQIYLELEKCSSIDPDKSVRKYIRKELLKNIVYFRSNMISIRELTKIALFSISPQLCKCIKIKILGNSL